MVNKCIVGNPSKNTMVRLYKSLDFTVEDILTRPSALVIKGECGAHVVRVGCDYVET